ESFNTARRILREEGILIGSSSGTLIAAALKYCREQKHPNNVVTFVCDSGNKYISKMYNEYWLRDQGFRKQTLEGNLSDFVSRRFTNKEVICLRTDDLLKNAYDKMKQYEISQIPVLEDNSITGIIDESDVLGALIASPDLLNAPVRSYMTRKLITLAPEDSLSDVLKIFSAGMVPIIVENGRFIGLITKIDIINFLAKNKVTAHEIFN
ncbi:MAG TPA: CBS domain-containing protein, partial [Bacteroidales bacterium]|nr:CBS domain-containing protein [Bacteroidales bacterium]